MQRQLTNEELHALEDELRRELFFWILHKSEDAVEKGLPVHLATHAIESVAERAIELLRKRYL